MELRGEISLEVDELPKREKDRLALFAAPFKEAEQSREGGLPTTNVARQDAPSQSPRDLYSLSINESLAEDV